MTKPWEEVYAEHESAPGVLLTGNGQGHAAVMISAPDEETLRERVAFHIAAPDMAKVLLASGRAQVTHPDDFATISSWHTHECWDNGRASCEEACAMARAALTKAGVLLP